MNHSAETGPSTAELEELTLLLENRTFVDYLNTFLCLPVFGQHVFYNYMEMEFEFEPPIRNQRHLYLDRREVLRWLCTERLRSFKRSVLYTEYNLCMLLRNSSFELPGLNTERQEVDIFTKNVIGTAVGMMLFRESMRGTCGESVFRCWKDLEAWRLIEDPVRKMYWKHVIKTHYINENSTTGVASKLKVKVFHGLLNFDLVPESDIHQQILDSVTDNTFHSSVESDEALLKLQTILLDALRKYWLPRHLLHIMKAVKNEVLDILKKPAPGDMEYMDLERRLRCQYMFPTIYQESSIHSPATTVLISQSAGDFIANTPSVSMSLFDGCDEDMEKEKKIDPMHLLSLWGGPVKDIGIQHVSPSNYSVSLPEIETPDGTGDRKLRSAFMGTALYARSPVPIVLTSYLGGKKRTLLGNCPKTTNRVIWSLASDMLACCPFQEFLLQNGQFLDLKYLRFWTDVRNYLDADEHSMDGYGKPLKQQLAHRISSVYLSKNVEQEEIFSEKLKMSLFTALSKNDDITLLCMAQDIVQAYLWEPLKIYILEERRNFRKKVRGERYQMNRKQRRKLQQTAKISKSKSYTNVVDMDPMYIFNCETVDADSAASSPISPFSPTILCDSAMSRPATSYHVSITEEQMWKAMELAVLCSEYGVSMMLPQYMPQPSHIVDVLYSDYGSLHLNRVPTVRHEWLRSLTEKKKIDIETIQVSREILQDNVDIATLRKNLDSDDIIPKCRGRMHRRTGLMIERPKKPKSLMEVLSNPVQFDFFKRFMIMNKMCIPVTFWRAVEDLQDVSNSKARQIRVTQIMRKFFGKYAKYGAALDCDEEIIRQIPNMEKVTPGILICAQAAVFRSLERKWFPSYRDTFPPESDSSTSSAGGLRSGMMRNFGETAEFISKAKKAKKRVQDREKTMQMWVNCSRHLAAFVKAINCKGESQLFEMFLKYEVEREKQSPQKDLTNQMPQIERSIMMSAMNANVQTRVVVRNRLVIMNRLPSDVRFWIEVRKYQSLVDSAQQKSSVSDQDTEFLTDKAKSIISCFLNSDILPKVQVNVPNDMALNIINSLASVGPKRGLFHDAVVLLFPILYYFYRKFSEEWLQGNIPDEYFDTIEQALRERVSSTPHRESNIPDFTALKHNQIKTTTQLLQDENTMRIHFSISEGVTLIYPQAKLHKSPIASGRRMTKHAPYDQTSPRKESRGGHGDKKDSKHAVKGEDKMNRHKETGRKHSTSNMKSEKIVVKISEQATTGDTAVRKGSVDKARRLSFLVESLNKGKEAKIKEQNRLFSKLMSFDEVVSAARAAAQSSETSSMFSKDISPS